MISDFIGGDNTNGQIHDKTTARPSGRATNENSRPPQQSPAPDKINNIRT
jgi:hypothetical protein